MQHDLRIMHHHFCTFHMMIPISIMHDHLIIIMRHGEHDSDVRHFTL